MGLMVALRATSGRFPSLAHFERKVCNHFNNYYFLDCLVYFNANQSSGSQTGGPKMDLGGGARICDIL